jgi:hypothetical protein
MRDITSSLRRTEAGLLAITTSRTLPLLCHLSYEGTGEVSPCQTRTTMGRDTTTTEIRAHYGALFQTYGTHYFRHTAHCFRYTAHCFRHTAHCFRHTAHCFRQLYRQHRRYRESSTRTHVRSKTRSTRNGSQRPFTDPCTSTATCLHRLTVAFAPTELLHRQTPGMGGAQQ